MQKTYLPSVDIEGTPVHVQMTSSPFINFKEDLFVNFKHTTLKTKLTAVLLLGILVSCGTAEKQKQDPASLPLKGTWQLLSGTLIEKGDTTVTDYTKNTSFIKIINDTHFAFLQHDLTKGKDSAVFVAGGGRYSLTDSLYTEKLEYCSARDWEGNDFNFTVTISNDTLVQRGVEKVESAGVDRINIEKYVRVKTNLAAQKASPGH